MKPVKALFVLGLAALIALAVWQFVLKGQISYARLATAYAAKQVCSCRFIGERSMQSCMGDFTSDISMLKVAQKGQTIVARAPYGLARAQARYSKVLGCAVVE